MIFVAVGNASQPFSRLLTAVDNSASSGVLGTREVVIQSGRTPFQSSRCSATPFFPEAVFHEYIHRAEIVITHGGCGTMLDVVRSGKVPIVMPRRRQYGEHVNDHQLELTETFAQEGYAIPVFDRAGMEEALVRLLAHPMAPPALPASSRMSALVADAIKTLSARKRVT